MTVRYFRSDDANAPTLTATSGSLAALLKACLVDGYTGRTAAGWTLEINNTHTMLFKNSTGSYFKVKDNGYQYVGQSSANYNYATVTGAKNYTDIDTLINPYPRTISGENLHSNTFYGLQWNKWGNGSTPNSWIVVADSETCYLFVIRGSVTANAFSTSQEVDSFGMGDLGLLANVVTNPKGFVAGGSFDSGNGIGYSSHFMTTMADALRFMEHPLTGGAESTVFYLQYPNAVTPVVHSSGIYTPYPSPVTGGAILEPIYITDDSNNVVRTYTHTNYKLDWFAKYKGLYTCPHQFGTTTGKIGQQMDVISYDGREYLLLNLPFTRSGGFGVSAPHAVDITGPW